MDPLERKKVRVWIRGMKEKGKGGSARVGMDERIEMRGGVMEVKRRSMQGLSGQT